MRILGKEFVCFLMLVGIFLIDVSRSSAQLQVNGADKPPYDPVNLIHDVFLGSGVTVLQVKYEGEDHAVGYFDHAQNQIGIQRGIIMSTGRAEFAQRPNLESNFSSFSSGIKFPDADLIKALGLDPNTPEIVRDLARYEITFIPHADSLRFNYVFASEEYPKYSCSQFKDVFGFFISGPDPQGGEYQSKNIALVPGTGEVVSISTVNNGDPSTINCLPKNGHLYNDNTGSLAMTYNAYLDLFSASVKVVPCQTYVIKLALSDIADDLYDSAVFLEAKSFATNEVAVDIRTIAPDGNISEGCQPAVISFKFENPLEDSYDLGLRLLDSHSNFILATDQVDFSGIPDHLSIPAGQKEVTISIVPVADQLNEGLEWIALEYQKNICQKDTLFIGILDKNMPLVFAPDSFSVCSGDTIQLIAELEQGFMPPPPLRFQNNTNFAITPVGEAVFSPIWVQGVAHKYLADHVIDKVCIDTAWIAGLQHFEFYLVSPQGKVLELSTGNGKRTGGGNPIDSLIHTCFSLDADENIHQGNPAQSNIDLANPTYTGDYLPEGSWQELWPDGTQEVNGLWQLMVIDNNTFIGHLESWSISFNPDYRISYSWTPDDGTLACPGCKETKAFPTASRKYHLEAMDSYGCISTDSSNVEVRTLPEVTGLTCDSVSTDFLSFHWDQIPSGFDLEFSIDGTIWNTFSGESLSFSNLGFSQPVTLSLRLSDGICTGSVQQIECVTLPCPAPDIEVISVQHLDCYGDQDGSISIMASGTLGPYLYELNAMSNDTGHFPGLAGGSYTLYITDGEQCRVPYHFTIQQPEPLTMQAVVDSIVCHGQANGSITLQTSGGNGSYVYQWSGAISATGTISSFDQLGQGTYHIEVNDAKGCNAALDVSLADPPKLFLTAIITDVLCKPLPTGAIQLYCNGGYGPYRYDWKGNGFGSTASSLQHITGGLYHLTITDAGNCSIDTSFLVREPSEELTVDIVGQDTLCYTGSGAYLEAEPDGGTPPYQFFWQNGMTQPLIDQLQSGIYSVLITDRHGCTVSERKEVIKLPPLTVDYEVVQPDCAGRPNGKLLFKSASYGSDHANEKGLRFEWNTLPGQFAKDAFFLKGDRDYRLVIGDQFGCNYSFELFMPDPASMEMETVELHEVSCFGKNDGLVEVSVSGGMEPYKYHWSPNAGNVAGTVASDLSTGYYWLTVTDAVFCTNTFNIYISGPTPMTSTASIKHVDCYGNETGAISVNVAGGVPPYMYWWDGQPGSDKLTGLEPDSVFLEISDRNGCVLEDSFVVKQPEEPLSLTVESTDVNCPGGNDGSVLLNASGGTLPYAFSLNNLDWQKDKDFYGLSAGDYTVYLRDGNGCRSQISGIRIEEVNNMFVDPGSDTTIAFGTRLKLQPKVSGDFTGELSYQWTCSDMSILSCDDCEEPVVSPRENTIVFLEVTNGLGCVAEGNIKINVVLEKFIHVPDAFTPNVDGTNDLLQVFGSPGTMVRQFIIVDFWGKKVFELRNFPVNQTGTGWDGNFQGQEMSAGVYYWMVEAQHSDLSSTTHKGTTLLIK